MKTELRKRLEEAAKKSVQHQYNCKGKYPCSSHMDCEMCEGYNTPFDCCECSAGDYYEGFIVGAKHGYKEAIKYAKEWLLERLDTEVKTEDFDAEHNVINVRCKSRYKFLTDFETEMNNMLIDIRK